MVTEAPGTLGLSGIALAFDHGLSCHARRASRHSPPLAAYLEKPALRRPLHARTTTPYLLGPLPYMATSPCVPPPITSSRLLAPAGRPVTVLVSMTPTCTMISRKPDATET